MQLKKSLLALVLVCSSANLFAQKAEIGISGGPATTWLMNKNAFDYGDNLDPVVSLGGNYGVAATVYFSEKIGLGIELSNAMVVQKYKGVVGSSTYDSKTKLTYFDVPLLLKLKSGKSGFYFEIGPKLSYVLTAREEYSSSGNTSYAGRSIRDDFNKTIISGVAGIGGRINVVDALTISLGLRLSGGITDATLKYDSSISSAKGGISGVAANVGSDGSISYKRTTLATAGLQIGVLYRIGK